MPRLDSFLSQVLIAKPWDRFASAACASRRRGHRSRPGNRAGRAFTEDDHAEHLVLGNIPGPGRADDLAVLHHTDAVGEVEHIVDVVADQEYADPFGFELPDQLAHL